MYFYIFDNWIVIQNINACKTLEEGILENNVKVFVIDISSSKGIIFFEIVSLAL